MTVTEVALFDVARDKMVRAKLCHTIGEQQLADWEQHWVPALFRARRHLADHNVEGLRQSRPFDWREKVETLRGLLANPGFSITCDGLTQGMMIVDTVRKRSRIKEERQHLVYVEYVESAPWNRPEVLGPPRYRGVGSILIRAAIALSEEMEFHGRIGLHSLPQANAFYANACGMTDLGVEHERLRYFEMTSEQARAFITKGGDDDTGHQQRVVQAHGAT